MSGKVGKEAHRTITDDCFRRSWLHVRRVGLEPAGARDVGYREHAGEQIKTSILDG